LTFEYDNGSHTHRKTGLVDWYTTPATDGFLIGRGLDGYYFDNASTTLDRSVSVVTRGTGDARYIREESGTFTPVIRDAATGGNTGSASNVEAHYYKVGKLVFVRLSMLNIDTTGMTGSNNFYITGLPFVAEDTTNSTRMGGNLMFSNITFADQLVSTINDNQSYIRLVNMNSGAGWSYTRVNQLSSGVSDLWMTFTYQTA